MSALFDGKLDVFTTCRDCGELMKVVDSDDRSHPTCAKVETEIESLHDLYDWELGQDEDSAAQTLALIGDIEKLELGRAAVEYASWGWPVFPLATLSKGPAISKAAGGNGFKDATTERYRIERRWTKHPANNVGIATGHAFDVIDVDTKDKDGNPTPVGIMNFLKLLEGNDIPECHGIVVTASGGVHLYVKATGKGCFGHIRPGIDYRGRGGYVVAPPSTLGKPERTWRWLVEPSPVLKGKF